jgi:hypothetical protein
LGGFVQECKIMRTLEMRKSSSIQGVRALFHRWAESRVLAVLAVMNNLRRIKAWVGLGRFVLQSYEKVGIRSRARLH